MIAFWIESRIDRLKNNEMKIKRNRKKFIHIS
jgi:hypothetical protein